VNGDVLNLSPTFRTWSYVACLVLNMLAVVGLGLATVWELVDPVKGAATAGVILAGVGIYSNALALGYRPTRGAVEPDDEVTGARPSGGAVPRLR